MPMVYMCALRVDIAKRQHRVGFHSAQHRVARQRNLSTIFPFVREYPSMGEADVTFDD